MINWFDMPAEGLSNGGQFEVKELEVTENGTYEEKGEMYNKVVVNVEGGGGSGDFSTAEITLQNVSEIVSTLRVSMGVCMSETPNPMTGNYIDMMGTTYVPRGGTGIQKVLLYHGEVNVRFSADEIVSVDGNIVDTGSGLYKITGDCSVIAKGIGQA